MKDAGQGAGSGLLRRTTGTDESDLGGVEPADATASVSAAAGLAGTHLTVGIFLPQTGTDLARGLRAGCRE